MITFADPDLFFESRQIMNRVGEVYRYLVDKFGNEVEIEIIDPRNSISFFMILLREKRVRKGSWRSFIHSALYGQSKQSIIINGQLFSKGELPSIQEIEDKINYIKLGAVTI